MLSYLTKLSAKKQGKLAAKMLLISQLPDFTSNLRPLLGSPVAEFFIHHPSSWLICMQKNEELINVLSLAMKTQNRRKHSVTVGKIILYLGKNLCSEINRELKMTQFE